MARPGVAVIGGGAWGLALAGAAARTAGTTLLLSRRAHDGALPPGSIESKEEDGIVAAIVGIIKDQLPLDFTDYKQTTILRRIKRRATFNYFNNLSNYLTFL